MRSTDVESADSSRSLFDACLFQDVTLRGLVETMPLDWNCDARFGVVVDGVLLALSGLNEPMLLQQFQRFLKWGHMTTSFNHNYTQNYTMVNRSV